MTSQIDNPLDWFDEIAVEHVYPKCQKCGMTEYYQDNHPVAKAVAEGRHDCAAAREEIEADHLEDCAHDCRELDGMVEVVRTSRPL